jgi:hypothetical protein
LGPHPCTPTPAPFLQGRAAGAAPACASLSLLDPAGATHEHLHIPASLELLGDACGVTLEFVLFVVFLLKLN